MQRAHLFVCLSVCRQNTKTRTWAFQRTHYWTPKIQDGGDPPSWKLTWRHFFSAEGGPIWIKFRRLVQNDTSTAVIWPKSKPEVEFKYDRHLGEFSGMSSKSHLPHCRVLPPGEFTVMIPEPHATLQGAANWWIHCHDPEPRAGCKNSSAILKIVFRHIFLFYWCSSGFDERRLSYRLRYTCYYCDGGFLHRCYPSVCPFVCSLYKRNFLKN